MTYISKETRDRIEADAKSHVEKTRGQEGRVETYKTAAIGEAARAQDLVDALEWIKTYGPCDALTVRFIDKKLAKYKEVTSEPG
jgi:hypothetical protein